MGWLLRGAVALVLACGVGASTADGAAAPPPARSVDFARAQAAYAALQHWFTTGDRFVESSVASAKLTTAYAWPASQALAATLGMAAVPGLSTRYRRDVVTGLNALESYRETGALAAYASSVGTSAAPAFYDDNEWIALDRLGAYTLTHETRLLLRARAIFELVVSGWAGDAGACSGGVYWMRSDTNRDRNAVTTENGALLGLQLYALTHEARYLQWAQRMDEWSRRCLQRRDGLLADHIAADGTRNERAWSYNQGAAIAVAVLLARATGVSHYLDDAEQRAQRTLAFYGSFAGEPRIFVAIFFRDLGLLDAVRPRPAYRLALARYAADAWQHGRVAATGLFTGVGPATLLDQAAMVQIYAQLAADADPRFSDRA